MNEDLSISIIEGKYVRLERIDVERHAHDLYEISKNDRDIFTFLLFGPFENERTFKEWMEKQAILRDRIVFAVFSKRLNKYVGMYSLLNIDIANKKIELGSIWYAKIAQKTEINTESTFLCLRHIFEELGFNRVEWKCDIDNEASKKSALRMGFIQEGIFRKHMIVKGKNRNTVWYSIISDDWQQIKNSIENKLIQPKYD